MDSNQPQNDFREQLIAHLQQRREHWKENRDFHKAHGDNDNLQWAKGALAECEAILKRLGVEVSD